MRRWLTLVVLLAVCLPARGVVWWNQDWDHRLKLVPAAVPDSLMLGVVLVLDGAVLSDIWGNIDPFGQALIFTEEDGQTRLPHDVVNFDLSAQTCEVWVRTDSLGAGASNIFYAYYDAVAPEYTKERPLATWQDFDAVYTFDEVPGQALVDHSGSGNDADYFQGQWLSGYRTTGGKLGDAWTYGVNRTVGVWKTQITSGNDWTVMAWANLNSASTDFMLQGNPDYFSLIAQPSNSNQYAGQYKNTYGYADSLGWQLTHTTTQMTQSVWENYAWTAAGDPDSLLSFYLNGNAITFGTATTFAPGAVPRPTDKWPEHPIGDASNEGVSIGSSLYANPNASSDNLDGLVDHFTIRSSTVPAWQIAEEFSNQNDPGAWWATPVVQLLSAYRPKITSVDVSYATTLDTLAISGLRFGTHNLDIEWLGQTIEAASVGDSPTTFTGWDHLYSSQGVLDSVTTLAAYSGTKSISLGVDAPTSGTWESTLSFTHSGSFQEVYVNWMYWVRPNVYDNTCDTLPNSCNVSAQNPNGVVIPYTQFKWMALTPELAGEVELNSSNNTIISLFAYNHSDDSPHHFYYEAYTFDGCDKPVANLSEEPAERNPSPPTWQNQGYPWMWATSVGYRHQWPAYQFSPAGITRGRLGAEGRGALKETWSQAEWYADSGDFDVPNGETMWAVRRGQGPRTIENWVTDVTLLTAASTNCDTALDAWDRVTFYGLFDQTSGPLATEEFEHYIDDVYIQFGDRARIFLGNAHKWENCSRTEIQIPLSWSSTSATFVVQSESFADGERAWIYLWNNDELPNTYGIPITISASEPPPPPPILPPGGRTTYTPTDPPGGE